MRRSLLLYFIPPALFLHAQTPSGDEILKRVDQNITAENKIVVSRMIIHARRESRTVEVKSWQRGTNETFTEYLAPAREKGTKMLKLKDMLWMYSPSTDRTILISGHMLRQSVMGSDLSYEDMMEDPHLPNLYTASVSAEESVNGRQCWVLDLAAKTEDIAYYRRKIWVDKLRYIILKAQLYAKSGKLLKTVEVREVMNVQNRWIPKSLVYKDIFKEGGGTEFLIDSIVFDTNIPDHLFSKAALRK
ncbi:MAG: outer membrane lipoprotein-sorting protein [candidate division KSB1 bacterium]|nr:outer membrane lipoprotein-sorting protein [candidate division KSB1 bacterium]MDZ7304193.1 outer membrane lipoprotein-sorting protein [candidate division KSB1 bacterium]MDZ7313437.1 outer membrane lipoprotein-sorting protein [candidate division KSB1 bacterium]